MHAPPKSDIPIAEPADLEKYDGFLFGIPTRYGNFPAQWKAFWDKTGGQWQSGAFWGKYAGVFISTASFGGGQEATVMNSLSTMTHHGIIYVPLGYKRSFHILGDLSEVTGGAPWGAGTYAVRYTLPRLYILIGVEIQLTHFQGVDGSRQPTARELELAEIQGKAFYEAVAKAHA